MIGSIVAVLYFAGAVLAVWPIWRVLTPGDEYDDERIYRIMGVTMACLVAVFWPVVLVAWASWRISKRAWGRILDDDKVERP